MKTAQAALVCTYIMTSLTPVVYADRQLDQKETLALLDLLIAHSQDRWLTSGTIKVEHTVYHPPQTTDLDWVADRIEQETKDYLARQDKPQLTAEGQQNYLDAIPFNVRYKYLNEYTQVDQREVQVNEGRYHYHISVLKREDSIVPTGDLLYNDETNDFKLANSQERDFYWDGQSYTQCYNSIANAIISDQGDTPNLALAPLTVGLLAWGRGYLSRDNLENADIDALETIQGDQTVIHLTIMQGSEVAIFMVLDPTKDYAPLEHQMILPNLVNRAELSGYVQAGGRWIPTEIDTEQQDPSGRLLESHHWYLTIHDVAPVSSNFLAKIPVNTHVMRLNSQSPTALYYYSNPLVDTDRLLAERLEVLNDHNSLHNCATVQFRYAAERLGRSLSMADASSLVASDGMTSFLDMARMAEQVGLQARAVSLSWEDLQSLTDDVQGILSIPGRHHFVLLDHVSPTEAWFVDLSSNTFYRPLNKVILKDQVKFNVLLLSNESIRSDLGDTLALDDQADIRGGIEGEYCTLQIQEHSRTTCDQFVNCADHDYIVYYEYWRCEAVPTFMCQEVPYIDRVVAPCYIPAGEISCYLDINNIEAVPVWACDGEYLYPQN